MLTLDSHFRSWEIVDPRDLKDSTFDTVVSVVRVGGSVGGFVHSLHLQVVLPALDGNPCNIRISGVPQIDHWRCSQLCDGLPLKLED